MATPLINISSRQAYLFAVFLVLYEFATYMANDMIMPGMLQVVQGFHGASSNVATSLTAFILGGAALVLILGPLSDRFGRRPTMLYGVLFFILCTVFIACSQSMSQFILARFFQGMGLSFILVVGYASLQEIFSEVDAVRLTALMSNVSILAPLLGPLLGAVFIHYLSWHYIFVVIAILAIIAFWGLYKYMPEPVGKMRIDGIEIEQVPFQPRLIAKNYWTLLSHPYFLMGSIQLGLLILPCVAWIGLAPLILVSNAKLSVIQYSLWQIPLFAASILGNWTLRPLTNYCSLARIFSLGTLAISLGLSLVFILPLFTSTDYIFMMPGLILYFYSIGIAYAPLNRLILFVTPVSKGTTAALMMVIAIAIQGIGIELANMAYKSQNNLHFAVFCFATGMVSFVLLLSMHYWKMRNLSANKTPLS